MQTLPVTAPSDPRNTPTRLAARPDVIAAGAAIVALVCFVVVAFRRPQTELARDRGADTGVQGAADAGVQDAKVDVSAIDMRPLEEPRREARGEDRAARNVREIVFDHRTGPQVPNDNLATKCGLRALDGASVTINPDQVMSRTDGDLSWMTTKGTRRTFVFVENENGQWKRELAANGKRRGRRLIVVIPRDARWRPPAQVATLFESCDAFAAVGDSAGHSER